MRVLLIIGTVAEILLVVGVLAWYLNQVRRIERGAGAVWDAAQLVARNTATTWLLDVTSDRLDLLTDEALRHDALLRTGSSTPTGA